MIQDIRLSIGFWSHPKTKRLIREVGLDGVRSLQIFWCWVAQNRPSGDISDMDADDIEAASDWNGEQGVFYEAIRNRWIDETEDGICVHDWSEHNPWVAESDQRSDEARLTKLCQVNRDIYDHFRSSGRTGITRHEYQMAKLASKQRDASATLQRDALHSATAPAPAPAPSPAPTLKNTMSGKPDPAPLVSVAGEVVEYLNSKTGKQFRPKSEETKRLIEARIKQGFCLEDFKRVIDTKTEKWLNDDKMSDFLRPQTLFGTKFESYLNESRASPGGHQETESEYWQRKQEEVLKRRPDLVVVP